MSKMTQLIWNGVDSYIEINSPALFDYSVTVHSDGTVSLFTPREAFQSFLVVEVDKDAVPKDEEGEMILDGMFVTDDYKIWRSI